MSISEKTQISVEITFQHKDLESPLGITRSIISDFIDLTERLEQLAALGYEITSDSFLGEQFKPLKYRLVRDTPNITPENINPELELREKLNASVETLETSVRTYNGFSKANIRTIRELVQKTEAELLESKNFGRKSLNELKEILTEM